MNEATPKDLFLRSVRRCLANEAFIPAFYERFLASSEEIRNKFRFTDFNKQIKMLARSLELCAGAIAGETASLVEINERAKTHDRYHLNIEPRLYDAWLTTIIATASEFDAEWSDSVREAWEKVLGYVVQYMVRRY